MASIKEERDSLEALVDIITEHSTELEIALAEQNQKMADRWETRPARREPTCSVISPQFPLAE